jgi:CrcB protein
LTGALTALLTCVAGGMGAALRLILDGLVRERTTSTYPVGTAVINVTGSFLLGLITSLAASHLATHQWQLVTGTGLLGGYTTFSTASYETVRLIESRRYVAAVFNGLGMLLICSAAAAFGFAAALLATP